VISRVAEFEPVPDLELIPPCSLSTTMFKGILPARRVPSTDFTIITNLADGQGKENQPELGNHHPQMPATNKSRTASKGFMQSSSNKRKKTGTKRSKDTPVIDSTPVSGEAFDKLLVGCSRAGPIFNC